MVTETRQDRVLVALDALLPDGFTWEERCEPVWLAAFPCGIAPLFHGGTTVSVCSDQVVEAGAHLTAWDFESLLDALVTWVTLMRVAFQDGTDPVSVWAVFEEREPVEAMVLSATAAQHGRGVLEFLGAHHRDTV